MRVVIESTRKKATATNQWLQITCTQGRNRQIRKVLQHLQLTVTRLIRISYGDYQLVGIPKGMVKEVPTIPYRQHVQRGAIRIQSNHARTNGTTSNRSTMQEPASSREQKATKKTKTMLSSSSSTTKSPLPVQWIRMK
jgi:23S rRNA pseudouridine2605 synthase